MANISTGIKLAIAGVVIAAATAYMAFLGASSSWQYYVTVQECVKKSPRFTGQRIRVSGTIVPGTLKPTPDGCRDGSIQYTAITLNKKRQHLVKNRITMKKTKFIIATLACFAAARTLNVTRQRASKPRETIDLIRQERTDCDSKMPGPVMADIWLRATHIGPVLEGILNEPHTEARRAFN